MLNDPLLKSIGTEMFKLEHRNSLFKRIYERKIENVSYKILAQFNFKLLHNTLACGKMVSNWQSGVNRNCIKCRKIQDMKHLLFDCVLLKPMWEKIEKLLKYNH